MVREPKDVLNVVTVSFNNERDATQALTALQDLDSAGHVEVGEAGVIHRTSMGWVSPKTRREEGLVERLRDALDGPNKVTRMTEWRPLSISVAVFSRNRSR